MFLMMPSRPRAVLEPGYSNCVWTPSHGRVLAASWASQRHMEEVRRLGHVKPIEWPRGLNHRWANLAGSTI
jgi:hypothetical protein